MKMRGGGRGEERHRMGGDRLAAAVALQRAHDRRRSLDGTHSDVEPQTAIIKATIVIVAPKRAR